MSDAVHETEGVRKGLVWPAVALAMLFTAIFIVVAVGTYGLIACGSHTCGAVSCIVSPCTVFLAIVIWLSAASAVTSSGEINFLPVQLHPCAISSTPPPHPHLPTSSVPAF